MRQIHDRARVLATGSIGLVVQRSSDGTLYLLEFPGNGNSRRWYRSSELRAVNSFLHFLRANSSLVFRSAASLIAALLPSGAWYRAALAVSRLQSLILLRLIGFTPYRRDSRRPAMLAWVFNSWLHQLRRIDPAFPMEIKAEGHSALIDARRHTGGLVICSVHVPLVHAVLHSLVDVGVAPAGVVAGHTEIRGGRIPVWGSHQHLPGIPADQNVLLRMRRILCGGGAVFALVDAGLGDTPSRNIFRLTGRVGARLLLCLATLAPTGEIVVRYFDPPYPLCESEEAVLANLEFLQAKVDSLVYAPDLRQPTDVFNGRNSISPRPSSAADSHRT